MTRTTIPRLRSLVALLAALGLGLPAAAAVPGQVDFQGLLLDAGGSPVTGAVALSFTLYDAPTLGNPLWTESHAAVQVVDGVYDVTLGATTPLTPGLLSAGPVYLEIDVDGETLAPRRQLLAVPYALQAEAAESADALSGSGGVFIAQILTHFAFDGGDPPNEHPSEGFGDTDNDGLANFVDPDNDDDGISDTDELAQGSDINLVTPTISSFTPPSAAAAAATLVTIQGTSFEPGMAVSFGSETPVPSNVTATSLDVLVGPQVVGSAGVTLTRPGNGEVANASFSFDQTLAISGFSPPSAPAADSTLVTIQGTGFEPGLTVAFGSESPVPSNVTATSLDVLVGLQAVGSAAVTLTRPGNGENASSSFSFDQTLSITGFDPTFLFADQGGTVTVLGTGFESAMAVAFGSENPTPTNVTPTSFDVTVGAQAPGLANVTATRTSNGENASSSYEFRDGRVAFFVAAVGNGNLGGLAGADAICAAAAAGLSLPGSYLAWLADGSTDPASRFNQSTGPYIRPDGTQIADDWADLTDGTLDAPITTSGSLAWTNVATDGTAKGASHCSNWTGTTGSAPIGFPTSSGGQWTDAGTHVCSAGAGLYCFGQ
jgi:hypothetical protein